MNKKNSADKKNYVPCKIPPTSEIYKEDPDYIHQQEKYSPDSFWDGETIDDEK